MQVANQVTETVGAQGDSHALGHDVDPLHQKLNDASLLRRE